MQTKLIQIKDYLLLIDEEAEIKGTVGLCYNSIKNTWDEDIILYQGTMPDYNYIGFQKIIAYRKLNKEVKELDLPLLPPFENNSEIGGGVFNEQLWEDYRKPLNRSMSHFERDAFIAGYKAAQSKQFSLKDMEKAFEAGANWQEGGTILYPDIHGFAQSLSTQQLPKEFIPEYEYLNCSECDGAGWMISCKKCNGEGSKKLSTLKTITNSEGKQELVGIYKY